MRTTKPSQSVYSPAHPRSSAVRLQNSALDGQPESANAHDQHWALQELCELGGDVFALLGVLAGDRDGVRLRREQQSFAEHDAAVRQEALADAQRKTLKDIRTTLRRKFRINCPKLLRKEMKIGGEQERLRGIAARSNPETLAARRRTEARTTNRDRLYNQIPLRNQKDHLRGIQKFYVPHIVRIAHAYVSKVTPAVQQREGKLAVASEINRLTADLMRALYPNWAADLKPGGVRQIIQNAKKGRRLATQKRV